MRTSNEMVFNVDTLEEDLYEQAENYQPLNKLSTRKSGCKRLCSAQPRSCVELAMHSLVLQDIVLNIPAWARLNPDDSCQDITGPTKRMAQVSLGASVPRKRSKICKIQSSTAQISEMTGSCKKVASCTTGAEICPPNLPSHAATRGSPCEGVIPDKNNNNNGRTMRKKRCSRKQSRTRDMDSDCEDYNRSRSRSRSCSLTRSSSRETSRSRKRPHKSILKRSSRRSRSRRNRRGKKRSKRRVRFSRKITIWE